MRRFTKMILVIIAVLAITIPSFASGSFSIDLKSLSLDELVELRNEINDEIIDRVSSNDNTIYSGVYVVGEDIKSSQYMYTATGHSRIGVFESYENYKNFVAGGKDAFTVGEVENLYRENTLFFIYLYKEGDTTVLNLHEGNVVYIYDNPGILTPMSPSYAP